ncbi:DUF4239 domain-containing protein [Methylobacterium sp. 77]|uniref:bestrophin-like domain n=1 Tax=Methylobacterium sp. 77 TaxID=1101192 RepID=UPI00035D40C3|nr:DUF4239 domain-containing protein [Methylobacterium sp. 77]
MATPRNAEPKVHSVMDFVNFLYNAPIWQMACIIGLISVGGTVIALLIVDRIWKKDRRRSHNDIAGFFIAVVGVIYAILISSLAITVMARKDRAENLVFEEVEKVAGLAREVMTLPEANRGAIRAHLSGYLEAVVDHEWPQMRAAQRPTAGSKALHDLWLDAAALPVKDLADMLTVKDFRAHIDDLYDIRRGRSDLAVNGVDRIVWVVVLLGSISMIAFAVLFGVENFAAHLLMSCLLSFSIALAMTMIVAIDWPYYGYDSISADPLIELRAGLSDGSSP